MSVDVPGRMGLQLRRRERVTLTLERVIVEQLEIASSTVCTGRVNDVGIHEGRKAIKRARAVLRLMRAALSRAAFDQVNHGLRDAGRSLTSVRDAKVLHETLLSLRRSSDGATDSRFAGKLEQSLKAERERLSSRVRSRPGATQQACRMLDRALGGVERLRLRAHGWEVIGTGIERIYRDGRRAFELARLAATDENLHEWRKRTKDLWHALQVLRPLHPERLAKAVSRAHKLADCLGQDHDLAVLRGKVQAMRETSKQKRAFIATLDERRAQLQRRAFSLGRRLYASKPQRVRTALRRGWKRWKSPLRNRRGQDAHCKSAPVAAGDGRHNSPF